MAKTRWVVGLLTLGIVGLLGLQNLSPRLPLVFLGGRTLTLPVGLWLVLAIVLGALTTLALQALVARPGLGQGQRDRYRYEPQAFYEPVAPNRPDRPGYRGVEYDADVPPPGDEDAQPASSDRSWQDWTSLHSPTQWENWDTRRPRPEPDYPPERPPVGPPAPGRRSPLTWFGRRPDPGLDPRVQDSWQEINADWDDLEQQRYRPPGASPLEDSLEEIAAGWDDLEPPAPPAYDSSPPRDYDAPKPPTQVYRDGSIYAYSSRNPTGAGQTDRIYAPPDSGYGDGKASYEDIPSHPSPYGSHDDLDESDVDEPGVVEAEFRVIIPPPPPDSSSEKP